MCVPLMSMCYFKRSTSLFSMEVSDEECLRAAGCNSRRIVLGDYYFLYVRFWCVRSPCWVNVFDYGSDVMFVHQGNVFFGLAECYVVEWSGDIEAGFSLSVDVVCMCFEWHSPVVRHSVCCGRDGVGCGCVSEYYCVLCAVFVGSGCD